MLARSPISAIAVRRSFSDLARVQHFAAQLIEFDVALREQPRLIAETIFQILGAAAENFRLGGLRHQLLLEFGSAAAEVLDAAALFTQLLRCVLELDPLGVAAVFHRLDLVAGVGEPVFQGVDLGLERDDLDLLGIGQRRALVQFVEQLGEFGLLVGQRSLGVVHDAGFGRDFILGGAQLVAQRLVARFECENGGGLFTELHLEPVDGVALLAKLGELAGGFGLELSRRSFRGAASTWRIRRAADPCRPGFPPSTAGWRLPGAAWSAAPRGHGRGE